MTDEQSGPEQVAFEADLDRLRAAVGTAALAEASRRGIGEQMLTDALLGAMAANELAEFRGSVDLWRGRPKTAGRRVEGRRQMTDSTRQALADRT